MAPPSSPSFRVCPVHAHPIPNPQVIDDSVEAVKSRFLLAIRKGTLPFWSDLIAKPVAASSERFDVSKYSSAAELEALGLDALKAALMSLGLKCGWVVWLWPQSSPTPHPASTPASTPLHPIPSHLHVSHPVMVVQCDQLSVVVFPVFV